jgi:hypothetical protein
MFRSLGYPFAVAHRLAGLCTVETPRAVLADLTRGPAGSDQRALLRSPHLPQGAPTSPALANLLAFRLDVRLSALARAAQGAYTRYADDLFFSGGDTFAGGLPRFGAAVGRIAAEEGFRLNPGKTRIMRRYQRQSVTGIVVNDHCNAPRAEFERLKAILHNCLQNGPAGQDKEAETFVAGLRGASPGSSRSIHTGRKTCAGCLSASTGPPGRPDGRHGRRGAAFAEGGG